jgi:hypothetical protein
MSFEAVVYPSRKHASELTLGKILLNVVETKS